MWLMSFGLKSMHFVNFKRKSAFSNIFFGENEKVEVMKVKRWQSEAFIFSHKLAASVSLPSFLADYVNSNSGNIFPIFRARKSTEFSNEILLMLIFS